MTLVIGEALVDIVRDVRGAVTEHVGGSPLNVAVGLARLGHTVEFVTRTGDDERGGRIRSHLEESGVRIAPGSITTGRTATAQATLDAAGSATYEFDIEWDISAAHALPASRCVHTGSIAGVMEPGCVRVAELLETYRPTATVSYDPNVRPSLVGDAQAVRDRITTLVALADIVKVSDEDLHWFDPDTDPADIAQQWLSLGPAVVIVTAGGNGAFALTAAERVDVPAREVDLVDTVGAGDSFMAGLLDGFASQNLLGAQQRESLRAIDATALRTVMDNATAASALTVAKAGADLPTRAMLDRATGGER